MKYSVNQLAKIAQISVRTIHYYDEIGILKAARAKNGYRYYEESQLLKLQQILFFRELDFPLEEINRIIHSPKFDMSAALKDQRKMIELKKSRLGNLIKTIDRTLKKINKEINMEDKELYGHFSKEQMDQYTEEARQKWGETDAFKQSQERVKKMGKEGLNKVLEESGKLTLEIAANMKAGFAPQSKETQALVARHYDGLRAFYEPNVEMYSGLAEMYVADERFKANYEKVAEGLAEYLSQAMMSFCGEHVDKN